jgi:hypothetical protein
MRKYSMQLTVVMAGLDPAIYAFATHRIGAADGVDHRVTPGDDDC